MSTVPANGTFLIALTIALALAWGLACGVCERLLLAPRHQFSAAGPAYFPGMTLAFLAGLYFTINDGSPRPLLGILMAGAFFAVGAVPALATFHFSRWLFRTRFNTGDRSNNMNDLSKA